MLSVATAHKVCPPRAVLARNAKGVRVTAAAAVALLAFAAARGITGTRSADTRATGAVQATGAVEGTPTLSAASREAQALREWLNAPVVPVGRNLFVPVTPLVGENVGTLAKSPPPPSDATHQQRAVPAAADRDEAGATAGRPRLPRQGGLRQRPPTLPPGTLAVQSTLMGAVPTAVVNGRVVREGDVIASGVGPAGAGEGRQLDREQGDHRTGRAGAEAGLFRVLRIEPRRVIVGHAGDELEVPLGPGQNQ